MEERRKRERRDPASRQAMSPETLQLLRLCGADMRSADDPEQGEGAEAVDRRRNAAAGSAPARAPAPARR